MANVKVFRDPIHVNLEFDRECRYDLLALNLIDCIEVQRLRHIRQLGLANYVYHGSEHSRFSHSLGVAHLAKRFYRAACRRSGKSEDEEDLTTVIAAAVLHDVGHPPFSHATEKALGIEHEKLTGAVLTNDTEVNRVLNDYGGREFIDRVNDHIQKASDESTVQIISSQLDADRLDYILRDGYHAGVPNASYDLERILQMAIIDDNGLRFDERACYAIEGYLLARYHLYRQLYYHKTVRAAEVTLRAVLKRARDLSKNGENLGAINPKLLQLFKTSEPQNALHLTDHDFWSAFSYWYQESGDKILRELCYRLLSRHLFKSINISSDDLMKFYEEYLSAIRESAEKAGFDPEYYVVADMASDQPYEFTDFASNDTPKSIQIQHLNGNIKSIEIGSKIIRGLEESAYGEFRCCFPEEIRDTVNSIIGN